MRKIRDSDGPASWIVPNYRALDITDIDFAKLAKSGITKVALDVDGTLLPAGKLGRAADAFITHLSKAQKSGHITNLTIATNRFSLLARMVADWISADSIISGGFFIRKPSKPYYDKVISSLGGKPEQMVMIGDRLLQDVFGGNRAGMTTILVDDLGPEPWYDKIVFHRSRQHKRLMELDAEFRNSHKKHR
jgi:HAD superfamily phosphatase (TIGR01668 family)